MALTRTSTVVCLSKMDSIYRIYFRCQRHTSESKTILFDAKSTLGKCSSTHINTKIVLNEFVHRQHPDMFDFNNGQEAYKSKHTSALVRALLVFNLCSIEFIVRNQQKLLKWSRGILGKWFFGKLMRQTFYGHFVAGADQESIKPVITANRQFGVKSILDYSSEKDISHAEAVEAEMMSCVPENPTDQGTVQFQAHEAFGDRRANVFSARTYFYEDEKQCDTNMEIFLNCIDAVSNATERSGMAAIKLTALGRPQLLMSEVLTTVKNFFTMFCNVPAGKTVMGQRRFELEDFDQRLSDMGVQLKDEGSRKRVSIMEMSQSGKVDLLDWQNLLEINNSLSKLFQVPDLKTGRLRPIVESLSHQEEGQLKNMLRRIDTIVNYAAEKEVRIMVDAEQTYFQCAISRLTMEMMRKFNKERSVVFNTYQCYLKQCYNNIVVDLDFALSEDFFFGAKLVRGAYMDQERERASTLGYEDPIHPTFEATTDMFNSVMEEVIRQINQREGGKIAVMIATHNEDTVRHAVQLMETYNVSVEDHLICFGQLLGMCDYISFPLGQAGYSVYKYVPFGEVDEVLPYLSRRAVENAGMLRKVQKEKRLLYEELIRRLRNGQLLHDPSLHVPSKSPVG